MNGIKDKTLLGIFVIVMLLLLMLLRQAAVLFFILIMLGGMIMGIYNLAKYSKKKKQQRAHEESIEGIIEKRMEQCNLQIDKNNKEIKDITVSIRELEFRLNQAIEVKAETKTETIKVIAAFKKELALRETKVSFYQTCKKKFSALLYNYNLTKDLARKKEKLSKLQEDNYDSVAEMEMMKSDVAYDFSFVEVITDLSSKMITSNSLDSAKALQVQLVEITEELKDL